MLLLASTSRFVRSHLDLLSTLDVILANIFVRIEVRERGIIPRGSNAVELSAVGRNDEHVAATCEASRIGGRNDGVRKTRQVELSRS